MISSKGYFRIGEFQVFPYETQEAAQNALRDLSGLEEEPHHIRRMNFGRYLLANESQIIHQEGVLSGRDGEESLEALEGLLQMSYPVHTLQNP